MDALKLDVDDFNNYVRNYYIKPYHEFLDAIPHLTGRAKGSYLTKCHYTMEYKKYLEQGLAESSDPEHYQKLLCAYDLVSAVLWYVPKDYDYYKDY